MASSNDQFASDLVQVSERRDHLLGPGSASVTLLEYGDYECPHCGQAHFVLQELLTRFRDEMRLAFRNFPLMQIHPHAFTAAEAAEAAGAQDAFWDMHDLLFENQDRLEEDDLVTYASALGLDVGRFQAELLGHAHALRVQEDMRSGMRAGVKGTPTFFINGRRHEGAWDVASLGAAISRATHLGTGDVEESPPWQLPG